METVTSPRYWLKDMVVIGFLLVVTGGQFWPLLSDPARRVADDYDGVLIAWTHTRVAQKILAGDFTHFFDGQIFYPAPDTLAYSDLYLTDTLLALPIWIMTHEPIAVLTYTTVLAQVLVLVALYFLLHELTGDRWLSMALSLVYSMSRLHLMYIGNLHTFQLAGVITAWLALVKLEQKPSKEWLGLLFGSFWFQFFNNFLTGWFVLFSAGIFFICSPRLRQHLGYLRNLMLLGCLVTGLAMLPIILPYLAVARLYHYVRPITDVINFSLSPEQLVTAYASPLLYGLIAVGLLIRKRKNFDVWAGIGLTALVMSLGPALHWLAKTVKIPGFFGLPALHVPLPYLVAYYLIPGFKGFRTPSRWITVAGLAAAVWVTMRLRQLPVWWRRPMTLVILGVVLVTTQPVAFVSVPARDAYPPAYRWLKTQPGQVVIELPIFRWGSDRFAKNETWRMLYQTWHGKTLVNGYSGFDPPAWEALVNRLQTQFPSVATINELRHLGVNYIIVHQDEYSTWRGHTINVNLKPIYQQNQTEVYTLN